MAINNPTQLSVHQKHNRTKEVEIPYHKLQGRQPTCVSDVTVTVLTLVTVTSQALPVLLGFTSLTSCFAFGSPEPRRSLIVSL